MIEDKILFSAWGANGGVDSVVASYRKSMRERGIKSDLIINDPHNLMIQFISDTEHRVEPYADFLKRDFRQYAVFDLHSCNFTTDQLNALRQRSEHIPIVAHVHGLNAHVGLVENYERYGHSPDQVEERIAHIRANLTDPTIQHEMDQYKSWDACFWQEELLKRADNLVFLTEFTRDKYRMWYSEHVRGNDAELIIPNGSDFHKYADDPSVVQLAAQKRADIGSGPIIMYSGRITPPKGATDLAKAFDRIKEQYPTAKLLLVGDFWPVDDKSCVMAHVRPDYHKDVIHTGWVADKKELAAYLKASDVMVLPSYHETFSISALEGMFMGTPVLMGDIDGSHEVYVEPCLAYGAKPGDVERMLHIFKYLFEDPERAKGNAAHVKQVVNEKYRIDNVVDQTIGLYNAAICQRYGQLMRHYMAKGDKLSAERIYDSMVRNMPFDPGKVMK
ncbi:MAG: glycosyltransferase family 4 protein [Nanoarchaeota archaeon]